MSVRRPISASNGVFFITFTCAKWLPLFELTNGYQAVYNWLDYLKEQKAYYMHHNPCKAGMVNLPEDYTHSSAKYYFTGRQGVHPVITYMELQDIDLTSLQS